MSKMCVFLGRQTPLRQLSLLAEGGEQSENMLDVHVFLAFRQLPALAERAERVAERNLFQ